MIETVAATGRQAVRAGRVADPHPAIMTHASVPEEMRRRMVVSDGLVRLVRRHRGWRRPDRGPGAGAERLARRAAGSRALRTHSIAPAGRHRGRSGALAALYPLVAARASPKGAATV